MTVVISIIALMLSGVAIWQSCESNRIACESNRIAREAQETTEEEILRKYTPTVEETYYIAKSPDLLAEYDSQWIGRLQLVSRPIRTRFWRIEWSQYNRDLGKWYVFVVITNRGPGRAENIRISNITWTPKDNMQAPDGLIDMEAPLGMLSSGEFYALLVDTLESPDPIEPLISAHFAELTLTVEYQDELGRQYELPINVKELGPSLNIDKRTPLRYDSDRIVDDSKASALGKQGRELSLLALFCS